MKVMKHIYRKCFTNVDYIFSKKEEKNEEDQIVSIFANIFVQTKLYV
jgi:hypothetical protein